MQSKHEEKHPLPTTSGGSTTEPKKEEKDSVKTAAGQETPNPKTRKKKKKKKKKKQNVQGSTSTNDDEFKGTANIETTETGSTAHDIDESSRNRTFEENTRTSNNLRDEDEEERNIDGDEEVVTDIESDAEWFQPDSVYEEEVTDIENQVDCCQQESDEQEVELNVNGFDEVNNSFIFILDELLLDILKVSGKQYMFVKGMEKLVFQRTGRSFSTLHDNIKETEFGSHGIVDFIDNDSKFFNVDERSVVQAGFNISPYHFSSEVQDLVELDLSNTRITSCQDLVTKCLEARNVSSAVLRKSTISDNTTTWPFGVLDLLCWFCPKLRQVDLTGCVDLFGNNLNNVSNYQSWIQVIDYLDPSFILNCTDAVEKIRKMLDKNSISPSTNCHGWSPLHSAILLGDKKLVKELLARNEIGDDNNNIYNGFLQTSMELATVLHQPEIVELFKNECNLSISPSRLVEMCLLPQDGLKNFDHPAEALTSNKDALQKARCLHNPKDCNLIALLQIFYDNNDIQFKKELLEGLFQKVQECTVPDCLFLSCWDEKGIRDAVQILMEETGCSANGKIDGFPYLMFSMPSVQMLELLMQEGAQIDEKDWLGCTGLFHAVEKALTSASPQSWNIFIEFLLRNKANPNARNDLSETPLLYSLSSQFQSCEFCSKVMMCQDSVSSTSKIAFEVQVVEVWGLLLAAKARANVKDERDRSVLHLLLNYLEAGDSVQTRKCLALICNGLHSLQECGFEINSRDAEGNTPLHLWANLAKEAIGAEATEIGKEIISRGGAVNARNDKGETPLHLSQCWEQVEILVENGAQLNVQNLNGDTPFHKFIGKDSLIGDDVEEDRWKKCLASEMNPWYVNNEGKCPFEVLLEEEFLVSAFNLLKVIFEDDRNKTLAESARCYKDRRGNSLLHILCTLGNKSAQLICEYLLKKGFDVDFQNECKQTPLHVLCSIAGRVGSSLPENVKNCICLLRKFDAGVNIPDVDGHTCKALLSGKEDLQNLLDDNIEKVSIPMANKIKWRRRSVKHEAVLAQVVRGTQSRKVESYHHHEDPIGKGSFSLVFPAVNEKDGREVALKRLEKARLQEKGVVLEREVNCLLELSNCPYVVNYISCTSDYNFEYIVVELMEGSLDSYLSCDEECENASTICLGVSSGMEFLHKKGVLHRDLKPQNILYRIHPNFTVKISDFGLSKILQTTQSSNGSESVMHSKAGTRCWMAPELLGKSPQKHSKASDIFSCGLLFHYVLTKKKHPFCSLSGEAFLKHPQETEKNIKKNKKCFCPSLSPEATHLITDALFTEPRKRPVASSLQHYPFFWDDRTKVDFLKSVGNQTEFEEPRSQLTRQLTDVEKKLENFYSKKRSWKTNGWEDKIQEIYDDVTSGYSRRNYNTKSAVELVRFIRNSHVHVYNLSCSNKELLLEKFVFLQSFPCLVTETFKAVKASDKWKTRKDLKHFFK
ncbi:uncharacterized protein LOC144658843 isoform X1 [Oculina patagonica]